MLTDKTPQHSNELATQLDFLFGRLNFERITNVNYPRHFKLESMRRLLQELGDPQTNFSIIHVAGTKGKGSVSRMIANALSDSGIATGVYSSPHIESICERVTVNGKVISQADLASALKTTRQAVERLDALADQNGDRKNSFFEIITATSLLHFQRQKVEKVVLEVGLGGRLDSTNVCEPELCVITNISLDHTKQLGSTVDLIAREKAGIIKRGVPVISGVLDPLAAREIQEATTVNNSDLVELGQDFHVTVRSPESTNGSQVHFDTHGNLPERHAYQLKALQVNSLVQHQAVNAAIAIAALKCLPDRYRISDESIRQSLLRFQMIGRGEIMSDRPLIIVDMAHNVASINVLLDLLNNCNPSGKRRLIFASSKDKDAESMLQRLLPEFDEVTITRFLENPRAQDPTELLQVADTIVQTGNLKVQVNSADHPQQAWEQNVAKTSPDDALVVAGSTFLVAETRPLATKFIQELNDC